ncbi:MAG: hypothetical protein ABI537_09865 [Casimicrobiaceae bacterium]
MMQEIAQQPCAAPQIARPPALEASALETRNRIEHVDQVINGSAPDA